ncbi:response regulator [Candidatus Kaiserbacteria bacterium]|nr:response regulator [Candidatus Kaiserbacteria bacterium]
MSDGKKKILVIEDSPSLAESLEDMLRLNGFEPIITVTGQDGVDAALEHHPSLILLDIRLPDIDGYEVFHQIRADEWGKTANIIVLTASESTDIVAKNINLDSGDVLFKPDWSIRALLEVIRERLTRSSTQDV